MTTQLFPQPALESITFTVPGKPQSRGSKKAVPVGRSKGGIVMHKGRPIINMVDSNKKSGPWMRQIARLARAAYQGEPMKGPMKLTVCLYFKRPKRHYGTGGNSGVVKDSAPVKYHTKLPDANKCVRAIEDALTGVVYVDDSQVAVNACEKVWTHGKSRAEITVEAIA